LGVPRAAPVDARRSSIPQLQAGAEVLFDELWSKNKNHPNFAEVATIMGEGYWNAVSVARSGGPGSNYQPSTRRSLGVWKRIIDELPETEFHTAEAYFFAGECHRYLEEWAQAIEKYEELVERWPDFMYSERAQLTIIRCLEKLIRARQIPKADGVTAVREACFKLINDYPESRGVHQAKATLKKWEPFEAALIGTMERNRAWSERNAK
jgi:outer membrane protein assembly factor BamD (BamD/ComL family)